MEALPKRKPEAGDTAEAEDIPSDFFDDFNKADFIEGLSVIDSWDDKDKNSKTKSRFNADFVKVKDNRNSISDEMDQWDDTSDRRWEEGSRDDRMKREDVCRDDKIRRTDDSRDERMRRDGGSRDDRARREGSREEKMRRDNSRDRRETSRDNKHSMKGDVPKQRRSSSISRLEEFIKPGSRRDPNKTNEAIKRDKEEKVKEFLAKSLESSDDLRPPGTELDDYFEGGKPTEKKQLQSQDTLPQTLRSRSRERQRESPRKQQHRRSPRWSPKRSPVRRRVSRSPRRNTVWRPNSPNRNPGGFKRFKHFSPLRERRFSPRRSPRRYSPRRSPRRHSPRRHSPHHSLRRSPRRSPRSLRRSRSRSPYRQPHRSRSPSNRDNFLYPEPEQPNYGPPQYQMQPQQFGPPSNYQGGSQPPGYAPYAPAYGSYNAPYDYGPVPMPVSQPGSMSSVPMPIPNPGPVPTPNHTILPVPSPILPPISHIPAMVPAPSIMPSIPVQKPVDARTPYDALAKLVADGKISKEDYLKLAPSRGNITTSFDKNRVQVLNRCSSALIKLKALELPNQLLFNHAIKLGPEPNYIAPKFCSPLKRQPLVQFQFTSATPPSESQQNKHLIDSIIAAVGLERIVTRPKKKLLKNTKDAACQTTKPFCDVCEIRESTNSKAAGTSIDQEHFCSTVHTQVVEQDLVSSKSVFNPSGSVGDGPSMSIAHLTPAQLVSQLAARAKTLKNPDPAPSNQYRRNQDYNYDYDNRGGQSQQYQNYSNYRY